jgi:hypothetical protein
MVNPPFRGNRRNGHVLSWSRGPGQGLGYKHRLERRFLPGKTHLGRATTRAKRGAVFYRGSTTMAGVFHSLRQLSHLWKGLDGVVLAPGVHVHQCEIRAFAVRLDRNDMLIAVGSGF